MNMDTAEVGLVPPLLLVVAVVDEGFVEGEGEDDRGPSLVISLVFWTATSWEGL